MDEVKFNRATKLAERLGTLHVSLKGKDPLCEYRKWLDSEEIESEDKEGWPKECVYDEENIKAFIKSLD